MSVAGVERKLRHIFFIVLYFNNFTPNCDSHDLQNDILFEKHHM